MSFPAVHGSAASGKRHGSARFGSRVLCQRADGMDAVDPSAGLAHSLHRHGWVFFGDVFGLDDRSCMASLAR